MTEQVDLASLAQLAKQGLEETRGLRREVADVRRVALQTVDYLGRLDRRLEEVRDDLELMLKMELGGSIAHL